MLVFFCGFRSTWWEQRSGSGRDADDAVDADQQLEQFAGAAQVQVCVADAPLQTVEVARPAQIRQVGDRF